jgi:hypothetical protein
VSAGGRLIDSSGIQALLAVAATGFALRLPAASEHVERVLQVFGLEEWLEPRRGNPGTSPMRPDRAALGNRL